MTDLRRVRRPQLRVNLTAQGQDALQYLQEAGYKASEAVNKALIDAAREFWEDNERQTSE